MASPCPNVNIRPLDCETDSITVCLEPGAAVTGTFLSTLVPFGGGTPVSGSRFTDTDTANLSLLGTTTIVSQSPVPTGSQRVVIDFFSYFSEVTVGLALTTAQAQIRVVGGAPILWQGVIGFTATAGLGSLTTFQQSNAYIFGGLGQQVELAITLNAGLGVTLSTGTNIGGYLVT